LGAGVSTEKSGGVKAERVKSGNHNTQNSNTKQGTTHNTPTPGKPHITINNSLKFVICFLVIVYCLEFVYWNLYIRI